MERGRVEDANAMEARMIRLFAYAVYHTEIFKRKEGLGRGAGAVYIYIYTLTYIFSYRYSILSMFISH